MIIAHSSEKMNVTMVTLVTWLTAFEASAALAMSSSLLLLMAEMKFR